MAFIDGMVGGIVEILTLLKANIRHKKGSFISIILLMILVSMSLTAILSVNDNSNKSIEEELDYVNAGNITLFMKNKIITDELLEKVRKHELVKDVKVYETVCSEDNEFNGMRDGNAWFMQKLRSGYKLLNEDLTAYEEEVPSLTSGEIYIPQGIRTKLGCDIGDTIKITTIAKNYEFKVKGFIVEPVNGASVMGWKQVFVSDEDFDMLYNDAKEAETEDVSANISVIAIYKADTCEISDVKFARQLNLDTGIVDKSTGSLAKEQTIHYTTLFPEVIGSILMVFIILLAIVVLIVIGHSISTGIEMEYVNLGVLKSQGFTQGKIRIIYLFQYIMAQIIGAIVGIILSIPLTNILGDIYQPIMAVIIKNSMSLGKSILVIAAILLVSAIFIIFVTRKVSAISPMRAISGGKKDIYFDSRIKAPISKKGLSGTLAFRQFTANKRQYIGIILIVSILVFFMMTVMLLGNVINSKKAMESMGAIYTELDVSFKEKVDDVTLEDIENTVEDYVEIEKSYYMNSVYMTIDGEKVYCNIYRDSESISGILDGREPRYDNEIVITDIIAEQMDLEIGDEVTVSYMDKQEEFIITGLYQSMSDTGICFAMLFKGSQKLGIENIYWGGYSLKDIEGNKQAAEALNEKYGDILTAEALDEEDMYDETISIAIDAMKAVIYIFSIIFSLIVVHMVCSKTFLRERMDIGIYKAIGFTSGNLRMQFAVRFLIVAVIGAVAGTVLSLMFSAEFLGKVLRVMGISHFEVSYTPLTVILPIAIACICFFAFAYIASRKIKKVEITELVIK